jgi:glycosyltransferase involved in cell wall biosynthesis
MVNTRKIKNISFVIIARNEEFGLQKCLASIADLNLESCEVICIDSGATDRTLDIMKEYAHLLPIKVFTIIGYSNAAIARNIGIKQVAKEYIFFVDGDVEVNEDFIRTALQYLKNGAGAVTGRLHEKQYSEGFQNVKRVVEDRFRISRAENIYASGGCFIVKKEIVNLIGFFDERLERNQDYDYTLRITRHHIMKAIPYNMGIHHTIGYDDTDRMQTHLGRVQAIFFGNLLRKNMLNLKGIIWLLLKKERGILLGGIVLTLGILFSFFFGLSAFLVFLATIICDLIYGVSKKERLIYRCYLHYLFPILTFLGFFYTIDRRKKNAVVKIA